MNGKDVDARHDNGETFRTRTAKSLGSVEAQSIGGRIRTGEKIHRRIKGSERKSGRAVSTSTGLARGMEPNNGQMGSEVWSHPVRERESERRKHEDTKPGHWP